MVCRCACSFGLVFLGYNLNVAQCTDMGILLKKHLSKSVPQINLQTLGLSITNWIVSSKIYDKQDGFNFEIVNFPLMEMFLTPLPMV